MRKMLLAAGAVLVILAGAVAGTLPGDVSAQGGNLLNNGSFEGSYTAWNGVPELKVPAGWTPWWSEVPHNDEWQNLRPEFEGITTYAGYGYRVREGATALRYFKSWATYTAGVYQVVGGISPGTTLEFTAWGHSWSCQNWDTCHRDENGVIHVWSDPPNARVVMKIGIDPQGGTNPFAGSVIWSPGINSLDDYRQFSVQATAQGSTVTVFLYAWQEWAAQSQDTYWDDARLVAVGQGVPNPPTNTAYIPTAAANAPTQVQPAPGDTVYVVQSGDTLSSIAYRYAMTVDELRALNGMAAGETLIMSGQQLIVRGIEATRELPTRQPATTTAAPTETPDATSAVSTLEPSVPEDTDAASAANTGRLIAFASDWDGDWEIFVADIDQNQVTQITDNDADDLEPAWSADGTQLAFASDRGGDWDVYVLDLACLDADGGCTEDDAVAHAADPAEDRAPAWSPDGAQLVFHSDRGEDGARGVYLVDLSSGQVQLLISSTADTISPAWQPARPESE